MLSHGHHGRARIVPLMARLSPSMASQETRTDTPVTATTYHSMMLTKECVNACQPPSQTLTLADGIIIGAASQEVPVETEGANANRKTKADGQARSAWIFRTSLLLFHIVLHFLV